ncbi:hypothetical protein BZG12_06795 [Salinivibrio kushneri]|nr:hypothetical protein BZG12_06795 [Salinivibrio kushneri]
MLPFPLDLHVLGLPPAFNLSHDQTLQFKFFCLLSYKGKTNGSINTVLFVSYETNELTVPNNYKSCRLVTQFIE